MRRLYENRRCEIATLPFPLTPTPFPWYKGKLIPANIHKIRTDFSVLSFLIAKRIDITSLFML